MELRKTLRIALWEIRKSAGEVDRRTAVAGGIAVVLIAAGTPIIASSGINVDEGIYRVGISEESPYYEAVERNPALSVGDASREALREGTVDLLVLGTQVRATAPVSRKEKAAAAQLRKAVERYNTYLMKQEAQEGREAAAFPVEVRVEYLEQGGGIRGGSGVSGGEGEGDATEGAGSGGGQGAQSGSEFSVDGGVPSSAPSIGGALSGSRTGTPADIVPPFPFKSLILSFAFLIPMNFVIQAHSSSFMDERVNRRGELLLVSPVSRFDIIVGKTLPYFGLLLGVTVLIALGIGGGFVSVASVVPVALVFLATSFVGAMFARSFKELTFVMVSSSVLLTSYVFVPAMFTAVERISSISPITLVVNELQGTGVGWTDYAFATLPLYLTALVLFGLGAGVYKEEDMFTQRRLPHKALDSVANWLHRRASVVKVTAFLIPLVFAAELLALALLFAVPIGVSIPVILVTVSLIEEVAKSVAVYAGFAKSVFERTTRNALVLGALSGAGFFLGEKITVVVRVVGIPELRLGRAAFGAGGAGVMNASPIVLVGLLMAPLALHVVTASISAVGIRYGKREYVVALVGAVALHTAYNLTVVGLLG